MNEKPTPKELAAAAKPLHEILCRYYNPHTRVIVERGSVEVVEGVIGALMPMPD